MSGIKLLRKGDIGGFAVKNVDIKMEKELAEFVEKQRKEQNLTQSELAEKAGVHYRSVQNIEDKKRVRKGTSNKVLKALGYEVKTEFVFKKI